MDPHLLNPKEDRDLLELDEEWVTLIREGWEIGMSQREILNFLLKSKEN